MGDISDTLYSEIVQLAHSRIRGDLAHLTNDATDVAHEVLLRGLRLGDLQGGSRSEVLCHAARLIREWLVDRARSRGALKRGGAIRFLELEPGMDEAEGVEIWDFVAIGAALAGLAERDPRQASIIELRYFFEYKVVEIAAMLTVSTATIEREARKARAWLRRELGDGCDD